MGMGMLGYTVDELYDLSPRQFWNAMQGYYERQQFVNREAWERMRINTHILFSIQLNPNDRKDVKQFMPFPWDNETKKEVKIINQDELKQLLKFYGNKSGS